MTDLRLLVAISALESQLVYGAGVSNASAAAHAPLQVSYILIDAQFRE
jgi:hypothetical protein